MTTIHYTVSTEVQRLLPQVFVDYLWGLAQQVPGPQNHAFLLTRHQLGAGELQSIVHLCDSIPQGNCHRVYGFEPINGVVRILQDQSGYRMILSGPLEAAGFAVA